MSKVKNLRGFTSWIVFALFPNSEVAWAALAGLGITLVLLAVDRRGGIPLDALVLDASTLIFFAALAVAAFAAPHAPLGTWSGALSFGWLGITAWGSIALRRPFTLGMARRRVPRELYEQLAFRRAQTSLTRLWAIVFTAVAAVLVLCDAAHLTFRRIKVARQQQATAVPSLEAS